MDINYTESFKLNSTNELFLNTTKILDTTENQLNWYSFSAVSVSYLILLRDVLECIQYNTGVYVKKILIIIYGGHLANGGLRV